MQDRWEANLAEHEQALAEALKGVASELRLSDPTEFMMLVQGEQEANISDLVNSSSELFFKKGSLRYGLASHFDLAWGSTPSISLDMEFRHQDVTAFFRLILRDQNAAIEVVEVTVDGDGGDVDSDPAKILRDAIYAAKLS